MLRQANTPRRKFSIATGRCTRKRTRSVAERANRSGATASRRRPRAELAGGAGDGVRERSCSCTGPPARSGGAGHPWREGMNPKAEGMALADLPPLTEVRKNRRIRWYRCPIEQAKLRKLAEPSDSPQLSPPLHALSGRGPRRGAAGEAFAARPLPASVVYRQHNRQISIAGLDSHPEELRRDRVEPFRQSLQLLGYGAIRRTHGRADEGRAVGPTRAAPAWDRGRLLHRDRGARRGGSRFRIGLPCQLAAVLRR